MSRPPLELIIYPKSTGRHGETVYTDELFEWTYRESDCDRYAEMKRLTDAELAAEYWQAHAFHERAVRGQSCIELILEREAEVWTRFATLPSYDEPLP